MRAAAESAIIVVFTFRSSLLENDEPPLRADIRAVCDGNCGRRRTAFEHFSHSCGVHAQGRLLFAVRRGDVGRWQYRAENTRSGCPDLSVVADRAETDRQRLHRRLFAAGNYQLAVTTATAVYASVAGVPIS